MRYDGVMNNPAVLPKTKHWLADGGVNFTQAFTTTPLCCPDRATMWSGRVEHNHGVVDNYSGDNLDRDWISPRYLQDAGYRTALVGKFITDWNWRYEPPHFDDMAVFQGGYTDARFMVKGAYARAGDAASLLFATGIVGVGILAVPVLTTGPAYAATAAQVLEFGPDGKYIREVGKHLYAWSFAHTVRVDKDDNLWAVDKGSDMVVKFNPEGRVTMVFGRKKEASDDGAEPWKRVTPPRPPVDGQFRQPTDVTWDTQGNIFISDGYINSRVAKFDKNGDWVKSWGEPGKGPGQFDTPHSIVLDHKGRVYVADRANNRIQIFEPDGTFITQWTNFGTPWGLFIKGDRMYVVDGTENN